MAPRFPAVSLYQLISIKGGVHALSQKIEKMYFWSYRLAYIATVDNDSFLSMLFIVFGLVTTQVASA